MVLPVGSLAPEFSLTDQFGAPFSLSDALRGGPVTLVFFPLAFSGVCQGELCELRDNLSVFAAAAVQLVGISVDSKYSLRTWAEQQNYNFLMLSDFWPHGGVAQQYDAFDAERGFATRASYVIGTDGSIAAAFATAVGEPRPLAEYREAIASLGRERAWD